MPLMNLVSAGGIGKATVTGTTGSPSVDSSTRPGKTIYNFTGSGTITVGTAGTCEVLIIGGGGGAGWYGGGGGGGGLVYNTSVLLPSGTITVTVGAGGNAGGTNGSQTGNSHGKQGNPSSLNGIIAIVFVLVESLPTICR
jgi:hypothetical protein